MHAVGGGDALTLEPRHEHVALGRIHVEGWSVHVSLRVWPGVQPAGLFAAVRHKHIHLRGALVPLAAPGGGLEVAVGEQVGAEVCCQGGEAEGGDQQEGWCVHAGAPW